ncbi:cytochrome P460 family protein [Aeoliella sp. ICT_H6.2]|uniref:Cytochrome P460 family protein n=1 Tax=Aeoliella straminimaris TaxID=2954799 RepID=A0A9X2FF80_9BACT|nr:cytochrome P460 family protein [Aeoliella straminimaris]MCO6047990.1 cytochrome P460 family protein [Aeoliella straminimaris]
MSSSLFRGVVAATLTLVIALTLLHHLQLATADVASAPVATPTATPVVSHLSVQPSDTSVAKFEAELFQFLNERQYIDQGWKRDKGIRDTGPYMDGKYYGTHPAVRVFYSPEVIEWLEGGRQGAVPNGAMIIKEQYAAPAERHLGKSEDELWESLESWTVMVKDSRGSHDGWFWSNPAKGQQVVDNHAGFSHPLSGFGLYCVRCHASTRSPNAEPDSRDNEFTFASLRNIEGYPGEPILFRVDDSWREPEPSSEGESTAEKPAEGTHPLCTRSGAATPCDATENPEFVSFYRGVERMSLEQTEKLPPVTHDWVTRRDEENQHMVTSNQCMSCHAGLLKPYGPTMFEVTGDHDEYGAEGWNISPYGEWRWTPMGLAGRDPVFLAQLESEIAKLNREFGDDPAHARELGQVLEDTCLKCHGAMGRHQFHADSGHSETTFNVEKVEATTNGGEPIGTGDAKYGALARDGISCMVCHRMQPRPQPEDDDRPYLQYYLETSVTGNLYFGPPNEVYGPFKDEEITTYPMQHALGITPKHSDFLQSSQLCGSCHTVTLPSVDRPLKDHQMDELNDAQVVEQFAQFHHHVEQATYLEWLNSQYENEFEVDNPDAKTCQDCHMSQGLTVEGTDIDRDTLSTRIAIIQDRTYPDAENLASHDDLHVPVREKGFSRHNFSGLNLFLLEMFDQFDDVLGVRTEDYMTGSKLDVQHARENFLQTARHKTATVELDARWQQDQLVADVTVTNLAGHRFPTGVGFRRAFLEFKVIDNASDRVLWSSGDTNSLGVLVDASGTPLPCESFELDENGAQCYQPHHEEITQQSQVQIYESLICNAEKEFTTSFIHGCETRKDNRLLPKGWTKEGPGQALSGRYLQATYPRGKADRDQDYANGSGSDRVRYRVAADQLAQADDVRVECTLYYQAMPPYFLQNLVEAAPNGPATRRLYFMLSHIDLEGTEIEEWKLPIATQRAQLQRSE